MIIKGWQIQVKGYEIKTFDKKLKHLLEKKDL